MPEHVHVLMSEPPGETPSKAIQKLKQRVSRRLRKRRKYVAANQLRFEFGKEEAPAFWQARFYDFNVYSAGKKSEKLNYTHANPVIRKLLKHPKDWPGSSWSHYRGERWG
jgi:REP-associated tyrosine transposase